MANALFSLIAVAVLAFGIAWGFFEIAGNAIHLPSCSVEFAKHGNIWSVPECDMRR